MYLQIPHPLGVGTFIHVILFSNVRRLLTLLKNEFCGIH